MLQELLLILEELWHSEPALREIPIYQTSGLAQRALSVYQTYVEMMNADIKAAFQIREQVSCLFSDMCMLIFGCIAAL